MTNGDVNTARLLLAVMDDPAWKDDIGKLANGFIGRQQNGAWHTTTANLWGGLALEKFSKKFESHAGGRHHRAPRWARPRRRSTGARSSASRPATRPARRTRPPPSARRPRPATCATTRMFLPWPAGAARDTLLVTQQGTGKPWLTLQSVAAVQLKAPFAAGYAIKKTITPVEQAVPGKYTRGDVLRVTLEVNASADMTWVVDHRPDPRRRDHPRRRPGPRLADRHAGREEDRRAAGRPSRNAASRPSAATTSTCPRAW